MKAIEDYAKAWAEGRVCLHPSDTLPGLSFNPQSQMAIRNFATIKLRAPDKSPISLIANWDLAVQTWKPLPEGWADLLQDLWPASLSVIWQASEHCPKAIIAKNGSCGLRLPAWTPETFWMQDLLMKIQAPFPSSSVNLSGKAPIADWATAVRFLKAENLADMVFIPELEEGQIKALSLRSAKASTLICIEADGAFTMLREGALSRQTIQSKWDYYAKRT